MKKTFLLIVFFLAIFVLISKKVTDSYFTNTKAQIIRDQNEISESWVNVYLLSTERIRKISSELEKHNCLNHMLKQKIDSINIERANSRYEMKKSFNKLEIQFNYILLQQYECINYKSLQSRVNDDLQDAIDIYNSKALSFNNSYLSFPKNLLINELNVSSKRVYRFNYRGDFKTEVNNQIDRQFWVDTGIIRNSK